MAVIDQAVETLERLTSHSDADIERHFEERRRKIVEDHEAQRRAIRERAESALRAAQADADASLDDFRRQLALLADREPVLLAAWDEGPWDEFVRADARHD